MDLEAKCGVCRQTRKWHMEYNPHHMFVEEGGKLQPVPPPQVPQMQQPRMLGDMVLRLALLKAGVISDLDLAEAKLWIEKGAELGLAVMLELDGETGTLRYRLMSIETIVQEASSDAQAQV